MNSSLIKYFCWIFLLFFNSVCFAQSEGKIVEREIFFEISYVLPKNDTLIVFLKDATGLGLQLKASAVAYQSYIKASGENKKDREFKAIGSGRIEKADTLVGCMIKLNRPTDSLIPGDVVLLKVKLPAGNYKSIFSELAFKKIQLADSENEKFYSISDFLYNDSKQKEDSLYALFLNDIVSSYEFLKTLDNLPTSVTDKMTTGRYAGKSVLEVMRDATRKDVESYLRFIMDFPGKYMSKAYKVNETFATWLINDAPLGPSEIKDALYPVYKNKLAFNKILAEHKQRIIKDKLSKTFATSTEDLIAEEKYTEAADHLEFAKTVANAVNDTAAKGLVWLYVAEINHKQDQYAIAIPQCDSSIKYSLQAKEYENELAAISKKVYCQYEALQFSATKKTLIELEKKLLAYKGLITDDVNNNNWQKRYQYEGYMYYKEGNYGEALRAYGQLIELNKGINSYESLKKNADYFKFIGLVLIEQGKPSNALDSFFSAAYIYKINFDTLNWAKTQNSIAYSYYKLADYRKSMIHSDSALQKLNVLGDFSNAGYSKSLMGSCYWELSKYDSAVNAHKESIGLRKKANNLSGQAHSWKSIGELYLLSGLKNPALDAYDSAAHFYQQLKDSSGLAATYNKKGNVFYNDENYIKAVEYFEKAKGVNSLATVEALYNLGNAWLLMDTAKARGYFEDCVKLSDSTKNTGRQFDATWSLTHLAYRTNNIVAADQLYQSSLAISKLLNTRQSYGDCLSLRGHGFRQQSQLDSALAYYIEAVSVFDSASTHGTINQLNNVADVCISMGNFTKAREAYERAIELAKESNNNISLGTTLESTSFLFGLTGDFEEGLRNSDSALAIFYRSGNILRLANAYVTRGTLLKSIGEYEQSINAFLKADSIYRDQMISESMYSVSNNIGVVYFTQGDYEKAIKYHRQALSQLKKGAYDESYFLYRGNIAEDLLYLKKYKEAETELLETFPMAKEKKFIRSASGMALALGKLYYDTKRPEKAIEYLAYALDYAKSSGEKESAIDAFTYLGLIAKEKNETAAAESNFRNATAIVTKHKIANGWEPFYQLGLVYFAQNKFDSSLKYFKNAVELLDKNSEKLYGGEEARKIFNNDPRKSDLYSKITFSNFNLGNINEAWAYANRSNIAGIKELSGSLSSSSSNAAKNDALKKLLSLQQEKKALEKNLEKQEGVARVATLKKIEIQEANYNNFLQDVVQAYPELSIYFSRSNADEFNNYKSKLPADAAVLLYLVNNENLMIFTLTNEKLSVDTMTIDVSSKINSFIEAIKNTAKQTGTGALTVRAEPVDEETPAAVAPFKDISNELYEILIASVADKIAGKKKLCIIPSGVFSNMPFQCLGKKTTNNNFKFLIEDYSVFYTNKMSIFNYGDKAEAPKNNMASFAAFGVPDATLSFNITEVKEIGKILGSDSTVYTDSRATESMAKLSLRNKKYIHFATHGVLNYSSDYSQSYLKLLPDKDSSNGNNGQLTMREIQGLGISDCDMVILSACQTAVSTQLVKGWNISPANSFLVSNVKTVVASLWKVADEPTGLLMQYFYENLSSSASISKTDALRQAQVKLSQNPRFNHPNYWGAFVLYGDWR